MNRLPAEDSHEISCHIFLKIKKDVAKLSSAAVVIGALKFKRKKSIPCWHYNETHYKGYAL